MIAENLRQIKGFLPIISFIFNISFAFYSGISGVLSRSPIMTFSGVCYFLLCAMQFLSIFALKSRADRSRIIKGIGTLLIVLGTSFFGALIFGILQESGKPYDEITMITIATYTFTKIITAIISGTKAKKIGSAIKRTMRFIRYSQLSVSLLAMQQSMLVSFGDISRKSQIIFNIFTGSAVCIFILFLGITLILRKDKKMAKSKIVKTTDKIAEKTVEAYKKIEQTAVSGYTKIEDGFVDRYLTHDGESVQEAKDRLKKETIK